MIDLSFLTGKTIAVFGLGRSGIATANALINGGATVLAWDDNEANRVKSGLTVTDLKTADWTSIDALVLSPGVPLTHPKSHWTVELAKEHAVEIIGDVELLARAHRDTPKVGITGTNGKSTTTALIGHILKATGRDTEVGGNLGQPVLTFAPLANDGAYVLELSSYQLDLTTDIDLDVAILLNVTPDHLDRHGDMTGYVKAKRRIFDGTTNGRVAVIGMDDAYGEALFAELKALGEHKPVPISGDRAVSGGVYAVNGQLIDDLDDAAETVLDLNTVATLTGIHNHQNAAAAYAAVRSLGLTRTQAVEAIATFPGLAHRQELVAVIDGISYVNDSKATNAEAAARALTSYADIYWIAGGVAKDGGIDSLKEELSSVRHAFLIGDAAEAFAASLENRVANSRSGDLETAVRQARDMALSNGLGGVVLLSPACASFDQYPNFEVRGDAFKKLVMALPGERAALPAGGAA